jgi:hypothetical protein
VLEQADAGRGLIGGGVGDEHEADLGDALRDLGGVAGIWGSDDPAALVAGRAP